MEPTSEDPLSTQPNGDSEFSTTTFDLETAVSETIEDLSDIYISDSDLDASKNEFSAEPTSSFETGELNPVVLGSDTENNHNLSGIPVKLEPPHSPGEFDSLTETQSSKRTQKPKVDFLEPDSEQRKIIRSVKAGPETKLEKKGKDSQDVLVPTKQRVTPTVFLGNTYLHEPLSDSASKPDQTTGEKQQPNLEKEKVQEEIKGENLTRKISQEEEKIILMINALSQSSKIILRLLRRANDILFEGSGGEQEWSVDPSYYEPPASLILRLMIVTGKNLVGLSNIAWSEVVKGINLLRTGTISKKSLNLKECINNLEQFDDSQKLYSSLTDDSGYLWDFSVIGENLLETVMKSLVESVLLFINFTQSLVFCFDESKASAVENVLPGFNENPIDVLSRALEVFQSNSKLLEKVYNTFVTECISLTTGRAPVSKNGQDSTIIFQSNHHAKTANNFKSSPVTEKQSVSPITDQKSSSSSNGSRRDTFTPKSQQTNGYLSAEPMGAEVEVESTGKTISYTPKANGTCTVS